VTAVPLLQVNDIELYYESHGAGDPLVVIGGLGLAVSEMRPLIEALAAGYRVIAVDNRGAGRSAKPAGPYSIEQMAADVAGLLARIGVSRAHVLGISMGGRIAMTLALDYPELVDHLVLVSTGPRAAPSRWRVRAGMAFSRLPGLRGQDPQPRYALHAQFQATSRFDRTGRLGEISQPTLVVHGRADRIAPVAMAREMHAAIPGSRLTLLDGGHLVSLLPHRQGKFVAAVREFLPPGPGELARRLGPVARHDRDRLRGNVRDDHGDPGIRRVPANQGGGVHRPQQARQSRRGCPAHHAQPGEPVVRRQVVGPDPAREVDGEQLAQPGGQVDQRPVVADEQAGLDLRKSVLRLRHHRRQEGRHDHRGGIEARPQHGHHVRDVPVLLELHVEPDPSGARPQHFREQRRTDPRGGLDLGPGERAHGHAADGRVVEGDQLAVTGPADVELDHVGAHVDRVREGRDGVLRGPGRDSPVRGDHGFAHKPKYALVR
jgi:3-oxoadipate enol-lactonase